MIIEYEILAMHVIKENVAILVRTENVTVTRATKIISKFPMFILLNGDIIKFDLLCQYLIKDKVRVEPSCKYTIRKPQCLVIKMQILIDDYFQ